jgi:signal transduction histidine kinase
VFSFSKLPAAQKIQKIQADWSGVWTKKLPYKPRIIRVCLLLVIVPLVVGAGLNQLLQLAWTSTNMIGLKERAQNSYVRQMNQTFSAWNVTSGSILAVLSEDHQKNLSLIRKDSAQALGVEFDRLKQSVFDDPQRLSKVLRLQSLMRLEPELVASVVVNDENKKGAIELVTSPRFSQGIARAFKIRSEVKQLLRGEWEALQRERDKEDKIRERMKLLLYCGATATLALGFMLMLVFARLLNSKLKTLLDNGRLIRGSRDQMHKLRGDDELAYINGVLEQGSRKLCEAEEHRSNVIAMVAHDARSPVMSAHINVDLLGAGADKYAPEVQAELDLADKCLAHVLDHVNALLSLRTGNSLLAPLHEPAEPTLDATIKTPMPAPDFSGTADSDKQPWWRLTVLQKVLLVIIIPLLLQMSFVLYVGKQLQSSENIVTKERQISAILMYWNLIQLDVSRGFLIAGADLFHPSAKLHNTAKRTFESVRLQLDELHALCRDDPDWSQFVSWRKKATLGQIERLEALGPNDSFNSIRETFLNESEMRGSLPEGRKARQLASQLDERDSKRLLALESEQKRIAERLPRVFIFSILSTLALAIILLLVLNADIARRLNILVANAMKLGQGDKLEERVAGNDQFSQLDSLLYSAETALLIAAAQRKTLAVSLTQDLQRPLEKAIFHLEQFEKLVGVALADSGRARVVKTSDIVKRVLKLLDDLLILESLQIGSLELEVADCDVHSLAEEAIEIVSTLATAKGIHIDNDCLPQSIKADKARIIQLLVNYISNAIKFSSDGSLIIVASLQNGEGTKISVTDNGPGMDADTSARVFQRYFQANTVEKQQGFGLGLAICKLIADSHGGQLGVESQLDKGSSFWLEIPSTTSYSVQLAD